MKKTIITLVALMAIVLSAAAQDLSTQARNFRSSIQSFLREEGFSPNIDSDGDLTFKKEGTSYWITFSGTSKIFIQFHREGMGTKDADLNKVVQACNYGNKRVKAAKAWLSGETVNMAVEMFAHSAEEFKYVFYNAISSLEDLHKEVKAYYNDEADPSAYTSAATSSGPFTFLSAEIGITDENNKVEVDFGKTLFDFQTKYLTPRIKVNVRTTGSYDLYIKFYSPDGLSTGSSSPSGYSYKHTVNMSSTGVNTYKLTGWGNKNAGNWKMGDYRIEFYYNNKKIGEKSFTVY